MKFSVLALLMMLSSVAFAEVRCGWIDNPTPANIDLIDSQGYWTIGVQGGHQAEGDVAWPSDDQFVRTNGNYGYFCGCIDAATDHRNRRVLKIHRSWAKRLSACLQDPNLPRMN